MDNAPLINALEHARGNRDALLARYGAALTGGDTNTASDLYGQLMEEEGNVSRLERDAQAVTAAMAAIERERIAKEQREAKEARAALLAQARSDHADLMKKAARIDKALAGLDTALGDMEDAACAFASKYESLGMHHQNRTWLTGRGWIVELVTHIKNRSHRSLRGYLMNSGLKSFGQGKPVAKTTPGFEALILLKMGDEAEALKDAA